jgi:hypothetical protein
MYPRSKVIAGTTTGVTIACKQYLPTLDVYLSGYPHNPTIRTTGDMSPSSEKTWFQFFFAETIAIEEVRGFDTHLQLYIG